MLDLNSYLPDILLSLFLLGIVFGIPYISKTGDKIASLLRKIFPPSKKPD